MKEPYISREKLAEITAQFPTPFHLYDEKGIRATARALQKAFSWNQGFKEYFAVKATPNPTILKILKEEGCEVVYLPRTPEISSSQIKEDLHTKENKND